MVVRCQSDDCRKPAPHEYQWRLVLAANVLDIFDLYTGECDFRNCPHCGATASIAPSLAGYFLVEDTLVLLDRGFDPEPAARKALAPLVTSLGSNLTSKRVGDLAEFKAVFAAKVKSVAMKYPYPSYDSNTIYDANIVKENIANWRNLQGEVLSAMLAGAYGVVPKFGLHIGHPDGQVEDTNYTINIINDLVLHLMTTWSIALRALTTDASLEEVLLRLVDSCGAVAFIADRLVETLAS